MNRAQRLIGLHRQLLARRDELFDAHQRSDVAHHDLEETEVEIEEIAQKEAIAEPLAQLDNRERAELDLIDRALTRNELGDYGTCEVCGRRISINRLEAVPWTSLCSRHAKEKS